MLETFKHPVINYFSKCCACSHMKFNVSSFVDLYRVSTFWKNAKSQGVLSSQ